MKVRIVYDQLGNILSADWAVEGQSVGEFDLPEGVTEHDEELFEDEEVPKAGNVPDDLHVTHMTLVRGMRDRKLRAQRLNVLNRLRVDPESNSLQPREET